MENTHQEVLDQYHRRCLGIFFFFDRLFLPSNISLADRIVLWVVSGIVAGLLIVVVMVTLAD